MRRRIGLVFLVELYGALGAQPTRATETASQPAPAASSRRDQARRWFSTAVSLARAGRYAEAKNLFLEAYAAEPHYLVLYNIAQADIQLGELASAATFLRRFLVEGGSNVTTGQRSAIEHEIELLEASSATSFESRTNPSAGLDSPDILDSEHGARSTPAASSLPIPIPSRTAVPSAGATLSEQIGPAPAASTRDNDRSRLPGYLLLTGGFAVAGAGVGLFVWNHERYHGWQRENRLLTEYAAGSAQSGELADLDEAALRARVANNNQRLNSIQSFDPVPLITVGVGLAAIAAGVWALIANDESELQLSGGPSELVLQGRWTW
jgi:tetratricopeptide (TPR) repeat protein